MTDVRLKEVLDQFEALPDADFEKWVAEQPDSDEIGKELVSLFITQSDRRVSQSQR